MNDIESKKNDEIRIANIVTIVEEIVDKIKKSDIERQDVRDAFVKELKDNNITISGNGSEEFFEKIKNPINFDVNYNFFSDTFTLDICSLSRKDCFENKYKEAIKKIKESEIEDKNVAEILEKELKCNSVYIPKEQFEKIKYSCKVNIDYSPSSNEFTLDIVQYHSKDYITKQYEEAIEKIRQIKTENQQEMQELEDEFICKGLLLVKEQFKTIQDADENIVSVSFSENGADVSIKHILYVNQEVLKDDSQEVVKNLVHTPEAVETIEQQNRGVEIAPKSAI